MSLPMVRLLPCLLLALAWAMPGHAQARVATARIDRITTPVATLHHVQVQLAWAEGATQGELHIRAGSLQAPDLGYRFRDLDWRCPLKRAAQGWQCEGVLRTGNAAPFGFSVAIGDARTDAALTRHESRITVRRSAGDPDLTRIDLARVPLVWTQSLLAQAWNEGRVTGGTFDASLAVNASPRQPLAITGPVALHAAGFDTPDGMIAAEGIAARFDLGLRLGSTDEVSLDGRMLGGELLFGRTYVSLGQRNVPVRLHATHHEGEGWRVPSFAWSDAGTLEATGSAVLAPDVGLRTLDLQLSSDRLQTLGEHYLSGWLGAAGLGELQLRGAADAHLSIADDGVRSATLSLADTGIDDPRGRFTFHDLEGDLRFSADEAVTSEIRWGGGALYGLDFGPARLPWLSADGVLRSQGDMVLPLLGGSARFRQLQVRPPSARDSFDVRFGLELERLDVRKLAQALDWPAFGGVLSGRIPQAHYTKDRLTFDGGLAMQLFDGRVEVSSLAMERPFGTAPTLTADIALDDLDLEALTGVFGFGSITGRLDGRIDGLRLVDWQPVAFDAQLFTERKRGVRQRISQRAVQDLSSVGDASFVTTLQGQLIGLFDDFGYSRIGIGCRLADEVCMMDGLGSAGRGFIIVAGSGIPRLTVVGFNRRVDWPTLLERLAAVGTGDVKPVVD
jgi:hypothetical protein